jgi:nicotinate phosphoribosyltransferase
VLDLALHTDLYQLTMAYGYFKSGRHKREAVFHHFFRKKPFGGEYAIAAGLEDLIHFIEKFEFTTSDLDYLASLEGCFFDDNFLKFLSSFKFDLDIDAVEEGSVVFPYEPMIRVKGPILHAQLLESPLLNLVNFQTLIATKASRITLSAEGGDVVEFGLRRAQGINGALCASRAAFIGGASSTSNVLAGKKFGIPLRGTHAHSWVMSYENEKEAFESFAELMPNNCVLLVDTYDSIVGAKKAIEAGGINLSAIRLDSGDLAQLSIQIRALLDNAGLSSTKIMASNELDEYIIKDLKYQGAKIDIWGVGTSLATGKGQAALDGVYKLSCLKTENGQWRPTLKISEQLEKISNPGILNIRRFFTEQGNIADMIFDSLQETAKEATLVHPIDQTKKKRILGKIAYKDLLNPIFRAGKRVYDLPPLVAIQKRAKEEIAAFHPSIMRLLYPNPYFVGLEQNLFESKLKMIEKICSENSFDHC